ncbi:MAG TPA: hypothetical protein VHV10_19455 [Ktedonobacteraceae bacterium]|nr:hypothetical protein [Ktedonobacteraceae bacterium]
MSGQQTVQLENGPSSKLSPRSLDIYAQIYSSPRAAPALARRTP